MISKTVFCPTSVAKNDITAHSISYPRKHVPLHFLPLRATFDETANSTSLFLNISGLISFFRLHMFYPRPNGSHLLRTFTMPAFLHLRVSLNTDWLFKSPETGARV